RSGSRQGQRTREAELVGIPRSSCGGGREREPPIKPSGVGPSSMKPCGLEAQHSDASSGLSSGSVLPVLDGRDASYAAGSLPLAPSARLAQEALHLERLLSAQHVVDASAQLRGQNRQALARAMLRLQASRHLLPLLAVTDEERRGLRERPLQMGVADLGPARAELLPGRAVLALHQPGIGEEVLDSREAADVLDLVEDRHGQD